MRKELGTWRNCKFKLTDAEAPILCPPHAKSWLIAKNPDTGKDWRQEKGMTEDEMVEWHHQLNGHEVEQTLGDSERQGSLACCSPRSCQHVRMTWAWFNNRTKTAICLFYFIWFCYIFGCPIALPGLSLFAGSRDYLICGVRVSPCSSLSCWGVYALESIGFNSWCKQAQ